MEIGEPVSPPMPSAESKDKPRIVICMILHGEDEKAGVGGGIQYVNLPKVAKWVDGIWVMNKERLGPKLRLKVKFNKPGAHDFKLRIEPGSSNTTYTGPEKGRNAAFKYQDVEKSYVTDGDGTKVIDGDFFLDAAGNNSIRLIAKDSEGNQVGSGTLRTRRLVYYVELKMKGLKSVATSLTVMRTELGRQGITTLGLKPVEMTHLHNISRETKDVDAFKNAARTAYNGSEGPSKAPYVIAIAYTDHLAVKDSARRVSKSGVTVGPSAAEVQIPIVDTTKTPAASKYLWHDLVPGESWFVSASYMPEGGAAKDAVSISAAQCTAAAAGGNPKALSRVKVDVTKLPAGKGTISLTVNWVNMMRGGVSFPGNIVSICTRAWWKEKSAADQNQVMIHELGHQFKMVADGKGNGPDRVLTQYDAKGHKGSHCHFGLAVLPDYSKSTGSGCVMFGATNGVNTYCAKCTTALLKTDLSAGFTAF